VARGPAQLRIALSGYYGFGNGGDEAVLAGLIKSLRDQAQINGLSGLELTALSINPAATTAEHGIPAAHRYKIGPLLRTLARCDLLASGGGSLLQDVTSRHSIFYYLGVVRAAQIMGKKTMFIAQGIGPLTLPRSRKLTAAVARRCDAITVRDEASASLLREIGVERPEIVVTADPALLLRNLPSEPLPDTAIALRPWKDQTGQIVALVVDALKSSRVPVGQFFPCSHSEDIGPAQLAETRYGKVEHPFLEANGASESRSSHLKIIDSVRRCEMVVGMRLHALILAAAYGVPSVALAYDPKVTAFMEQTGQGDAVYDLRENDPSKLAALLAKVWSERQARAARLEALLPTLVHAAERNAEVAIQLFRRHTSPI
jgi:polysaccharide pyruvyl transferase CsaB